MSKDTLASIKEYLSTADIGYANNLPTYPEEDLYIQIRLSTIDVKIERGHDTFFYNGYKTESKRHLWYISFDGSLLVEKGYLCYKKAIKDALNIRKKEINEELKKVKAIQNKFKIS